MGVGDIVGMAAGFAVGFGIAVGVVVGLGLLLIISSVREYLPSESSVNKMYVPDVLTGYCASSKVSPSAYSLRQAGRRLHSIDIRLLSPRRIARYTDSCEMNLEA